MKLVFQRGKGEFEMVETIVRYEFPDHFDATYETEGVYNKVSNTFLSTSENSTKWISENEFQFDSIPMKIMGFLMPWMFKKQSQKYMDLFKDFAESREY